MKRVEPLHESIVDSLREPAGILLDPTAEEGVQWIQTHISHLFLTRERVYKLRKAVELPFLCFATREERNADCLREVALNRRLAPDVYLGVAAVLSRGDGGWRLGEPGEGLCDELGHPVGPQGRAAEHCVVMRRLPEGRDALSMIEAGALERRHVDALSDRLVAFHRENHLGTPAPWSRDEWLERIEEPVEATFRLAREAGGAVLDPDVLEAAHVWMKGWLDSHQARFEERRVRGRAVDGHGDLHLDHVWYPEQGAPPVVIDCIEFDPGLRRIDVAAELAFFTMDAAYRGRGDLGEHLLSRYAAVSDDYDLFGVVDYHVLHRALVRASVAAVAWGESEISDAQREGAAESARRHLALVAGSLDRPSRAGIILTTGLPGTGKSTVASEAARCLEGVAIVSDRVRKHQAGILPSQRGDASPGAGIYTEEQTEAVYAGLLERARVVLESGRPVVLDATYSLAAQREAVQALAAEWKIPALLLDVVCPEALTLERIEARLAEPGRISDADTGIYRSQKERYEPPREWPEAARLEVDTSHGGWRESLQERLSRVAGIPALPGLAPS